MAKLWNELITEKVLSHGWQLTRNEVKNDHEYSPNFEDCFASNLEQNIKEISNRLISSTYRPKSIRRVKLPKGPLGTRPGTVCEISDRVILLAIIKLLAPSVDEKLDDVAVYSYRLEDDYKKNPKKLFKESSIVSLPYLKSKTIAVEFDPWEPWYSQWPAFEKASRKAFEEDNLLYLATTDISAYFENIQLPLLEEKLTKLVTNEERLISLLMLMLNSWVQTTSDNQPYPRGIPQGTSGTSFLGNMFLIDLDEVVLNFCKNSGSKYFRYMDDIRVFCPDELSARRALLIIEEKCRELHLNLQTGKTVILHETKSDPQISSFLIDPRLGEVNFIIEEIEKLGSSLTKTQREFFLAKLAKLANKEPKSRQEQKIIRARKPLKGLTLRVFRRWITAHHALGSYKYKDRLLTEIKINPDYQLTRRIIFLCKNNPRLSSIGNELLKLLKSPSPNIPHQEAEIFHAIRYLSDFEQEWFKRAKEKFLDSNEEPYTRIQAGLLLYRKEYTKSDLQAFKRLFKSASNGNIKLIALNLLLIYSSKEARVVLSELVHHSDERITEFWRMLQIYESNPHKVNQLLKHLFEKDGTPFVADKLGVLSALSESKNEKVLTYLIKVLKKAEKKHPIVNLRPLMGIFKKRANWSLEDLKK